MPAASVIVTNWNGKKWLADCFAALRAQTFTDFELVFVDDGSTDGSADWVAENYPNVILIRQQPHLGFAGANNIGIRVASGRYIVTLNNDTKVDPAWLQELIGGLVAPDVGMVAAQMLVWNNPTVLDSAGIEVDWAGFGWNRGAKQPAQAFNRRQEVFGPCAGAALYRREMLAEIGLFDEDFYTYYEDVDLAWRARRAGWRCIYVPSARVLHFQSAVGRKIGSRKVFLLTRNRWWAGFKNIDGQDLRWSWMLILLYDLLALLYQTLRLRSLVPVQARFQAVLGAKKMLSKRASSARKVKLHPAFPFS